MKIKCCLDLKSTILRIKERDAVEAIANGDIYWSQAWREDDGKTVVMIFKVKRG